MQEQITQLHLEILALCFAVKAKGHDAFYSYAPHVDWATVRVFINGWVEENDEDKIFDFLWTKSLEDDDDETFNIMVNKLTECKEYLEGLVDAKSSQE